MLLILLSTIFGIFSSAIPELIAFYREKQKMKHQIEILRLKKSYEIPASLSKNTTNQTKHETKIDFLSHTLRPILTYSFFIIFLAIKIILIYDSFFLQKFHLIKIIKIIWDEETSVLFSAIIGFWFGHRAFERIHRR